MEQISKPDNDGLSNPNDRKLVKSISAIFAMSLVSNVLPLLNFIYLVAVLGTNKLAIVNSATNLLSIMVTMINFGLDTVGTNRIGKASNLQKRNGIYNNYFWLRVGLVIAFGFVWAGLVLTVPKLREEATGMLLAYLIVPGVGLMPSYVFQGISEMIPYAIVNLLIRIAFSIYLGLFVTTSADYVYINFWNGLLGLLGFVFLTYWLGKFHRLRVLRPRLSQIYFAGASSLKFVYAQLASNVAGVAHIVVAFFILPTELFGTVNFVDRLVWTVRSLHQLIQNAILGHLSQTIGSGRIQASTLKIDGWKKIDNVIDTFYQKFGVYIVGLFVASTIGLFTIPYILEVALPSKVNTDTFGLMTIQCLVPTVMGLQLYYYYKLVLSRFSNQYLMLYVLNAIISLVLAVVLISTVGTKGVALATLATEAMFLVLLVLSAKGKIGTLFKPTKLAKP